MPRKLDNWVDAFVDYTDNLPSPELFRKWCAISCVAGVLERKTWVTAMGSALYPTMYIILVAPPGVGKTVVTSLVRKIWAEIPDQYLAASSVTKASLIDDLREAERTIIRPQETPSTQVFHSLKIAANELGVFIPSYENDFMNVLTDIYDGHGYSERRRTKDINFNLEKPQINFLAATTPGYLNNMLPEGAWDQGFLSRTMLVYSGDLRLISPFSNLRTKTDELKPLVADLKSIALMYGEFKFEEEAANALVQWHLGGGKPTPDHPKLHNYLTRRTSHLIKLCMIASAASGPGFTITLDHYTTAMDWLIELEHYIPDIFKSMQTGGDSKAIEDTWYFAMKLYASTKKPIEERKIIQYLQQRVPAHSIDQVITIMLRAKLMQEVEVNKIGKCYIPKSAPTDI
jgi:hypothetical protein